MSSTNWRGLVARSVRVCQMQRREPRFGGIPSARPPMSHPAAGCQHTCAAAVAFPDPHVMGVRHHSMYRTSNSMINATGAPEAVASVLMLAGGKQGCRNGALGVGVAFVIVGWQELFQPLHSIRHFSIDLPSYSHVRRHRPAEKCPAAPYPACELDHIRHRQRHVAVHLEGTQLG